MSHFIDLTGMQFGRLVVLSRATSSTKGQSQWLCRCDCGTERIIIGSVLRDGRSKSCGCMKLERLVKRSTTHGHATNGISPTYHSWAGMLNRCNNSSHNRYQRYGWRGITVCSRWTVFGNFLADMGEKPKGTSIDRIDVDGDYTPENCRWANAKTQARNKTNSRIVTVNGVSRTVAEWAEITGINRATIWDRLDAGRTEEQAVSAPLSSGGHWWHKKNRD